MRAQKVKYRRVLEDDGKGKQKVEVEQVAAWKLLMFHGSFSTRLFVNQDQHQGTVSRQPAPCSAPSCMAASSMSQGCTSQQPATAMRQRSTHSC